MFFAPWRRFGDALGRNAKAVGIEIEKCDGWIGNRPFGFVEEVAGADPDVEVTGRDVAIVEPAQPLRRATPQKMV